MRRAALALGVGALAGCSSVLGLDPPTLDPCTQGGCADAALDGTVGTEDAPPAADVVDSGGDANDGAPEAPETAPPCVWDGAVPTATTGVRCGGGCAPVTYCTGATPVCCQTVDDAGAPAFACVTAADGGCGGYPIACVNENDCSGSDICCHYMAHTICAGSCTSNADITCVPGSANDCPAGKKCDVKLSNEGVPVPYYSCEP